VLKVSFVVGQIGSLGVRRNYRRDSRLRKGLTPPPKRP
jgi:hypothetical protein